jgi:hypothetical protein
MWNEPMWNEPSWEDVILEIQDELDWNGNPDEECEIEEHYNPVLMKMLEEK